MTKINPDDVSLLRGATLFLLASVIVSLAIWVGSWQYRQMAESEEDSAKRSLGAARAQLANARAQQQFFMENQTTYAELRAKNLFSDEKRLDWIETVHRLRDRHHIFNIDYELSPQERLMTPANNVAAYASKIDLKFSVLHEQDLLDFLSDFKKEVPGIFVLDSCALSRTAIGSRDAKEPNLTGGCTMQWITVKEKTS
jgi:hypothetical protein